MQARSLSTAAKDAPKEVKLPAHVFGYPGRYANALYVCAVKANQLDKVAAEVDTFMAAYKTDVMLKRYVHDPSIARNAKAETMTSIMAKNSDVTKQFFGEVPLLLVQHPSLPAATYIPCIHPLHGATVWGPSYVRVAIGGSSGFILSNVFCIYCMCNCVWTLVC